LVTVVVLNYVDGKLLLLPCLRHILAHQGLPSGPMDVWVVHNPPDRLDQDGTIGRRFARS